MIVVEEETDSALLRFGVELCCFCWKPTRFWYEPNDVAVCPEDAATHDPSDVPTKEAWCDEHARRFPQKRRMG